MKKFTYIAVMLLASCTQVPECYYWEGEYGADNVLIHSRMDCDAIREGTRKCPGKTVRVADRTRMAYNYFEERGAELGSYPQFKEAMKDEAKRRKFWEAVSAKGYPYSYSWFSNYLYERCTLGGMTWCVPAYCSKCMTEELVEDFEKRCR